MNPSLYRKIINNDEETFHEVIELMLEGYPKVISLRFEIKFIFLTFEIF